MFDCILLNTINLYVSVETFFSFTLFTDIITLRLMFPANNNKVTSKADNGFFALSILRTAVKTFPKG